MPNVCILTISALTSAIPKNKLHIVFAIWQHLTRTDWRLTLNNTTEQQWILGFHQLRRYHLQVMIDPGHHGLTLVSVQNANTLLSQLMIYLYTTYLMHQQLMIFWIMKPFTSRCLTWLVPLIQLCHRLPRRLLDWNILVGKCKEIKLNCTAIVASTQWYGIHHCHFSSYITFNRVKYGVNERNAVLIIIWGIHRITAQLCYSSVLIHCKCFSPQSIVTSAIFVGMKIIYHCSGCFTRVILSNICSSSE